MRLGNIQPEERIIMMTLGRARMLKAAPSKLRAFFSNN